MCFGSQNKKKPICATLLFRSIKESVVVCNEGLIHLLKVACYMLTLYHLMSNKRSHISQRTSNFV